MIRAILLWTAAYLLGSVPVGVIVAGWFNSDDPRTLGSGNIGATNVARTAGGGAGLVTLAGDCLKGFLAVIIARIFGAGDGVAALSGLAAFLGHLYPIFLDFKGGKGVATALGVFIALSPLASLLALIVFAVGAAWSHYVSLGSLAAAITMPVFLSQMGKGWETVYTALVMAGFIIYRHRDNILRICRGEESRFLEEMSSDRAASAPDTNPPDASNS